MGNQYLLQLRLNVTTYLLHMDSSNSQQNWGHQEKTQHLHRTLAYWTLACPHFGFREVPTIQKIAFQLNKWKKVSFYQTVFSSLAARMAFGWNVLASGLIWKLEATNPREKERNFRSTFSPSKIGLQMCDYDYDYNCQLFLAFAVVLRFNEPNELT